MKRLLYTALTLLTLAGAVRAQDNGLPEQLAKLMHSENITTRFYVDAVNEKEMVEAGIPALISLYIRSFSDHSPRDSDVTLLINSFFLRSWRTISTIAAAIAAPINM